MTRQSQDKIMDPYNLNEAQKLFLQGLDENPMQGLQSVVAFAREGREPGFVLLFNHKPTDTDAHHVLERYFQIQDQTRWPDCLHFFSDVSASYLCSYDTLWTYDPWADHTPMPTDLGRLAQSSRVVFGAYKKLKVPKNLRTTLPPLPFTRDDFLEAAKTYPQLFSPFLDVRGMWRRQEHIVSRPKLLEIFQSQLDSWQQRVTVQPLHLYGRIWGCGKTQTMYEWMRICKERGIPFVYKMWAAKDEKGNIMEESTHLNTVSAVTSWIHKHAPSKSFVLFVDEVDINPTEFPNCFIVSGGKELPEYHHSGTTGYWILDMVREFPLTNEQLLAILRNTINDSEETAKLFPQQQLELVTKDAHQRGFPTLQPVPLLIRALAYSVMIGLLRERRRPQCLTEEDVRWGIKLASCPWFPHYGEWHDVHAEFFVFDGERYTLADPFNPSFIP